MATINQVLTQGNWVLYEVEPSNWNNPFVSTYDDRGQINLTNDTVIDIVLLCEGYLATDQSNFEAHISSWYDNTFNRRPYSEFINAFRVQAVFTPSASRTNSSGDGYYGITLDAANTKLDQDNGDLSFREQLFEILSFVKDNDQLNTRHYGPDLVIGRSGDQPEKDGVVDSPRVDDIYVNRMRNCHVCFAIKDPSGNELSGFASSVETPPGHAFGDGVKVPTAFGRGYQHEFSHAFGLLLDEYIDVRGSFATGKQNPSVGSVFEMWNLSYTGVTHQTPWFHLSPNGLHKRSNSSRVGQMWKGGRQKEKGVWHPEYHCQMNGGHTNYFNRTDEPDQIDPGDGDQVYASLRMNDFCLWCEEILIVKIFEKTDAFLKFDDVLESGGDINHLGRIWYDRWVNEWRPVYWADTDVPARISTRDAYYNNPANLDKPGYFDGDISDTNLMTPVKERERSRSGFFFMQE